MLKYLIKEETLTATAEAIRNKTGQEEEIKPIDFPQWISKLSSPKNIKWHKGSFLAENKTMEVEHGIKEVPDFLMININPKDFNDSLKDYANASNTSSQYGIVYFSYGFSQALYSQFPEASVAGETRTLNNYLPSIIVNEGMDVHTISNLGELNSVTKEKFTLGSNSLPLEVGQTYNWIAITGLS